MNNNFRSLLITQLWGDAVSMKGFYTSKDNTTSSQCSIYSRFNTAYFCNSNTQYQKIQNHTLSNDQRATILVGDGDTPVADNDIWLANQLTGMEWISNSFNNNNNNQIQVSVTLKNTNAGSITIKEIGWVSAGNYVIINETQSYSNFDVLMHRELLPSPVTMEPNDIYTFTITLDTANV